MEIKRFLSPMLDQNMYAVCEGKHCFVIDPYDGEGSDEFLRGLTVDFLLVTHEHYDHISGVNEFKKKYGACLYANQKCDEHMRKPTKNYSKYFEAYVKFQKGIEIGNLKINSNYACCADQVIEDEYSMDWLGHRIFIKLAPGHSAGSNLIFLDDTYVFSGDCMLPPEVPAARFPGGDNKAFEAITLPYLRSLDGMLTVYPGHEGSFYLKDFHMLQKEADF